MLASLLPGLRDVRTPLTVGYLYLVIGWIWFSEDIPRTKPQHDGMIRRLFELSDLLGNAATIAALSFCAYLLGAVLTIPTERGLISRLLNSLPFGNYEAQATNRQVKDQ